MAPRRLGDEARRVGRERARVLARRLAVQRRDGRFIRGPEHDAADAVLDGGDDGLLVAALALRVCCGARAPQPRSKFGR